MNSIFALALRHIRWAACIPLLFCGLSHGAELQPASIVINLGTVNELAAPPNLGYDYPLHSEPLVAAFPGTTVTSAIATITTPQLNDAAISWNGVGGYRTQFQGLAAPVAGLTFPNGMPADVGNNFQVFRTNIDGVGVIVAAKVYFNLDIPADGTDGFVAITPGFNVTNLAGSTCLPTNRFSCIGTNTSTVEARVALVKIPRTSLEPATAPTGVQTGSVTIGRLVMQKSTSGLLNAGPRPNELVIPIVVNFTIDLKPRTCAILPSQADQTILLPVVTVAQMNAAPGQRLEPSQTPAQFNLTCQTPGYGSAITVFATLSDLINAANNNGANTVLGIEPGVNRATGMGIEMMRGADTVATPLTVENRKKGSLGQWALTPYGSNTSLTMRARYVKTGPITPGIVRSRAAITFSYQ